VLARGADAVGEDVSRGVIVAFGGVWEVLLGLVDEKSGRHGGELDGIGMSNRPVSNENVATERLIENWSLRNEHIQITTKGGGSRVV
jgi:hypothetical protein